jgi:hypothetical protein
MTEMAGPLANLPSEHLFALFGVALSLLNQAYEFIERCVLSKAGKRPVGI